jgi:hypothetical protein
MVDITKEAIGKIKGNFVELSDELATVTIPGGKGGSIGAFSDAIDEATGPVDTFADSNETLADNIGEVADKAKEASEQIKIYAEDVAENYIALAIAATESWEAFYEFWEEEAKRTSKVVEETVKKTLYKVLDEMGNIIGLTNIQQISPGETLVPITQPGPSTIDGKIITPTTGGGTSLTPFKPVAPGGNPTDFLRGGVTINIINPVVRNNDDITKIKDQVQKGYEEASRQFDRTGEVIPGMA